MTGRFSALRHRADPSASWLPVIALSIITLLIQGCTVMAIGLYLDPVGRDLGPVGATATLFLLTMSLTSWAVGWALQKIGPRPLLWAGIGFAAIGCLVAGQASDRIGMALAMALVGVGVGASTIVPGVAIITRHHAAKRGLALAIFLGASVVSGAVMPPIIGQVIGGWGWRAAFLLSGPAIALICVPLVLLIPREVIVPRADPMVGSALPAGARARAFLRLAIALTLIQLAINGVLFSAVDSLSAQGMSRSDAVAAYSFANLLGLPALLLGGVVADRIGARATLVGTALLLAVGTAALLAAGPMGMAGVAAFVLLWGMASALPGQSGSMLLADVVKPAAFARLLGLTTAIISLAGAFAPAWTDQMRLWSGDLSLPIWIYAALAAAAAPFIAGVRPRGSQGDPAA